MNIGTKIKTLRESNRLSQSELAEKLELSQGQLCKIESGAVEKIDFLLMHKICALFNVSFQYFLLTDSFSRPNRENKNSAISILENSVTYNNLSEIIETIVNNQEQITKLIEVQNRLLNNLIIKS